MGTSSSSSYASIMVPWQILLHFVNHVDRKSTRLNSSHTVIYTLSLHDALPIYMVHKVKDRCYGHLLLLLLRFHYGALADPPSLCEPCMVLSTARLLCKECK